MTDGVVITAPFAGWLFPLANVPDEAFASGLVGEGLAIEPFDDVLRAPCDGTIVAVAPTHHAVTLKLANDAELLIHLGLDTVKLKGEGFVVKVRVGDRVRQGDPLLVFDLDHLATRARSLATPIVLVSEGFRLVWSETACAVTPGDRIAEVRGQARGFTSPTGAGPEVRRELHITLPNGIHARPAARLVGLARSFASDLSIERSGKRASLRSPVALMTLGVGFGDRVEIVAVGRDADQAVSAIVELLDSGMGEAPTAPGTATPTPMAANGIAGVCAAPGFAAGYARQLTVRKFDVPETGGAAEDERQRLRQALAATAHRLSSTSEGHGGIAAAHLALLDDPELIAAADAGIARGRSAAAAWREATQGAADALRGSGSALLGERAADLLDLENQVLAELLGVAPLLAVELDDGSILLADELLPSQFMALDKSRLAGICTARGGATSHVAILAASAGIPMIVAAGSSVTSVADGALLVLDADGGRLSIVDEQAFHTAHAQVADRRAAAQTQIDAAARPAFTADGVRLEVFANLGSPIDAAKAVEFGAEGCGLLRTEFLFLDRETAPTADEQLAAYQAVASALDGRPLILRTLDIGGDKPVPYLKAGREENPALGLRGIRLSLRHRDLLIAQLEAALHVRPVGQCRIMIPMVSDIGELREVRTLLDDAQQRLGCAPVQLGVMIETPAAALIAEPLAREADFLSIGTNDLTQYALAMDRGQAALADCIDGLHPAVLQLIRLTVEGAKRHGRWVGVCGGVAADPAATAIFVGLGVDELSVVSTAVPALKARIRALSASECRKLSAQALGLASAGEVRALVAAWEERQLMETA